MGSFATILSLIGCDSKQTYSIESQSKSIRCSLNGGPLQIDITKGSLNADLTYGGKKSLVNLLKFQDSYQILMKFDPQVGQLKINESGTELTQFVNQQEKREPCQSVNTNP